MSEPFDTILSLGRKDIEKALIEDLDSGDSRVVAFGELSHAYAPGFRALLGRLIPDLISRKYNKLALELRTSFSDDLLRFQESGDIAELARPICSTTKHMYCQNFWNAVLENSLTPNLNFHQDYTDLLQLFQQNHFDLSLIDRPIGANQHLDRDVYMSGIVRQLLSKGGRMCSLGGARHLIVDHSRTPTSYVERIRNFTSTFTVAGFEWRPFPPPFDSDFEPDLSMLMAITSPIYLSKSKMGKLGEMVAYTVPTLGQTEKPVLYSSWDAIVFFPLVVEPLTI